MLTKIDWCIRRLSVISAFHIMLFDTDDSQMSTSRGFMSARRQEVRH